MNRMKAVIVIDMLNGFCRSGYPLSLSDSTKDIEKHISSKLSTINTKDCTFYFVCDSHTMKDPEINNPYPPHCMKGTEEAEIVDTLISFSTDKNTIRKSTLSIFFNTKLENLLKKDRINEIELVGVCTDICIHYAAFESKIRGYKVTIDKNGVLPLFYNQKRELNKIKKVLNVEIKESCAEQSAKRQ